MGTRKYSIIFSFGSPPPFARWQYYNWVSSPRASWESFDSLLLFSQVRVCVPPDWDFSFKLLWSLAATSGASCHLIPYSAVNADQEVARIHHCPRHLQNWRRKVCLAISAICLSSFRVGSCFLFRFQCNALQREWRLIINGVRLYDGSPLMQPYKHAMS